MPGDKYFEKDNVWLLQAIDVTGHIAYLFYNEQSRIWCSAGEIARNSTMWDHHTADTAGIAFPDPAFAAKNKFHLVWYGRLLPLARTLLDRLHMSIAAGQFVLSTAFQTPGRAILMELRNNVATDKQLPSFVVDLMMMPAIGTRPVGRQPISSRIPYTASFAATLARFRNSAIERVVICRKPISRTAAFCASLLFQKKMAELYSIYDALYHTFVVLVLAEKTANRNVTLLLEKNANLKLVEIEGIPDMPDRLSVRLPSSVPVKDLLDNVATAMGSSYARYEPLKNNCQVFVLNVLLELGVKEHRSFIYQPTGSVDGASGLGRTLIEGYAAVDRTY